MGQKDKTSLYEIEVLKSITSTMMQPEKEKHCAQHYQETLLCTFHYFNIMQKDIIGELRTITLPNVCGIDL